MWPVTLSGRLPIVGLVGRYLANCLMGRELTPYRVCTLLPQYHAVPWSYAVLATVSSWYPPLRDRLLTRYSPVRHSIKIRRP